MIIQAAASVAGTLVSIRAVTGRKPLSLMSGLYFPILLMMLEPRVFLMRVYANPFFKRIIFIIEFILNILFFNCEKIS